MTEYEQKMGELRQRFRASCARRREEVEQALQNGNQASLVTAAHSLAGCAGLFGYQDLGSAAALLQEAAASGDPALITERAGPVIEALSALGMS